MVLVAADGAVRFMFYRKGVQSVSVAGSFNHWKPNEMRMSCAGNGWWEAEVELPVGEYRFRYVADGQWFTDFAAQGVELQKNGWDSILIVGPTRQGIKPPHEDRALPLTRAMATMAS